MKPSRERRFTSKNGTETLSFSKEAGVKQIPRLPFSLKTKILFF